MSTSPKDSPEVLARFQRGLPLAEAIIRQLRRGFDLTAAKDEMMSHAHEALLITARSFDPAYGIPYERWAAPRVRGAIIDGLRKSGLVPYRIYRQLRAMKLAGWVEEGLAEADGAPSFRDAAAADKALTDYLRTMATAITIGLLPGVAVPVGDEDDDHLPKTASPAELSPEERFAEKELFEQLRAAMASLPDVQRDLVQKVYFQEMGVVEAGKELGLSKSWASRLLAQATEAIARTLRQRNLSELPAVRPP